jgi:hypothetical protein
MTNRQKLIDALDLICLAEGGSAAYEGDLVLMAEEKLKSLAVVLSAHERKVLVGSDDPNAFLAPQMVQKLAVALKAKARAVSTARAPDGLTEHEVQVLRAGGHSLDLGLKAKQHIVAMAAKRGQL